MNKLLLLSAGMAVTFSLQAQQVQYNQDGSTYQQNVSFRETKPLRELVEEKKAWDAQHPSQVKYYAHPEPDLRGHELHSIMHGNKAATNPNASTIDGALQSEMGTVHNDAPASFTPVNIDGEPSVQGGYPLDPNGMIGSTYYVQTVNSWYAVFSKTGTKVLNADLASLFNFSNFQSEDCGDPITMYDKVADRWVITEFEDCCQTCNIDTLLFAVSKTNDPTGAYYLYSFCPQRGNYDDYPKFVVWADGYYGTCNCSNTDYVWGFDRAQMIAGNATVGLISIPWNYGPWNLHCNGGDFFCPMLLDCDGTLPPYGSPEYLFYYWDDNWSCGGKDSICIEQITLNWSTKKGTLNAKYQHLLTSAFNSTFTGNYAADIPQPGNSTSNYMDALDGFFSYRIPYLRWGSYNSAVMCNVVNIGTSSVPIGAVRWYELHQDTTSKQWSIYQESTYGPNDGISRWNPAIAMDQNGSIGLEYSVSSGLTVYPGIRYTGRRTCDNLNTMTLSEVTVVSGNAIANTQENNGNRWGDYSHLSVDPIDGITFWGTNMYTSNGASFGENITTRVWNFQITKCPSDVPSEVNSYTASFKAYQNGNTLIIKGNDFPENEKLNAQVFDINGRLLMQNEVMTNSNTLETSFNVSSLPKAIYLVRVGNDRIQRVVKVPIN